MAKHIGQEQISEEDSKIYQKKLKRTTLLWRVFAGLAIFGILISSLTSSLINSYTYGKIPTDYDFVLSSQTSDYIGRLDIENVILYDYDLSRKLDNLSKDENIKGLIVNINSPGGTVTGSEQLYKDLLHLGEIIPIAIVMKEIATSGGYLVALAGKRIFASPATITGSIGVVMVTIEFSELLDKIGVKSAFYRRGKFKGSPNILEKTSEEHRKVIMQSIDDSYNMFVNMFAKRRQIEYKKALEIADGRIMIGTRALKNNMIDALGDEIDAIKWLEEEEKLEKDLPIINVIRGDWNIYGNSMQETLLNLVKDSILRSEHRLLAIWPYGAAKSLGSP